MIVVDASVATKWLLPESGSAAATALLRGDRRLLAPDIVAAEVAGAVTRRARQGGIDHATATTLVADWRGWLDRGLLELVPSIGLLADAAALSLRLAHPLADCLYLALAMTGPAELVTADATLARRASSLPHRLTLLPAS